MLTQCVFLKKKKHRKDEEKEQRKLEREEKRKKKEEEKKQKVEARELKVAERRAKQGEKGRRGPKRKAPSRTDDSVNNDNVGKEDDENGNGAEPVRKKARVVNEHAHEMSEIDTNQCCVCFIHYQDDVAEADGRNWIACSCGRWLHEDCSLIEPEMIFTSEEFCPKCVF